MRVEMRAKPSASLQAKLGQRVLGAQETWRAIELGVDRGQARDQLAPRGAGEVAARGTDQHVPAGTAIACRKPRRRHRRRAPPWRAGAPGGRPWPWAPRSVAERFAEDRGLAARGVDHVDGFGAVLVLARAVARGDLAGVGGFVLLALEADCEAVERLLVRSGPQPRGQRDDGAAVHAAGKKRAERHVRHQPLRDRVGEVGAHAAYRIRLGDRHDVARRAPVARQHGGAATLDQQRVRGRQFVDAFEDRGRLRHVAEGEVILDRGRSDAARSRGAAANAASSEAKAKSPSMVV